MDVVADLQRRCALSGLGHPVYEFPEQDDDGGVCRVFVGPHSYSAIYTGSKKKGRRNAASRAMVLLFGVFTVICVSELDPQIPYVRHVPKSEYLDPAQQSLLLNSFCPIAIIGATDLTPGSRVGLYPTLEAMVLDLCV